jgi:phage tail sheath protein FI
VDVGLIIAGSGDSTHVDNVISIAEDRKDAVAFVSPERSDVVNVANANTQTSNVIGFYNTIRSSSYVVFDSGYKYQYDRYNDVYRFVPLNGDIAGLSARTDLIADSWYSPAGFNRGTIRGAVKLAFNPNKTQRDDLYRNRVNAVVTFPGQGTVLFGDKTGLSAPSAFDRINVRRLFIVLEKAISTASKFQLFEFNDEFTRANFRNIVEPFLREVQGRRGLTDFLVVCDETNNTGEVIDRNEFIAEIFVKPARSINFITLQFVATRTGVSFEEVAG